MQSTNVTQFYYNNYTPTFESTNRIPSPFYHLQIGQEFNSQTNNFNCNNSTCDESDEKLLMSLINERKQRRMISNRESARRSRMRKQKHLDQLWVQVNCLQNENHLLMNKLDNVSKSHDQALEENAQLKQETSRLRQMVSNMKLINSPNYPCSGSSQNE